jgi:hypothetical protein
MIISVPPPRQIPFTAQITGLRPLRRASPPNPLFGIGVVALDPLLSDVRLFHSAVGVSINRKMGGLGVNRCVIRTLEVGAGAERAPFACQHADAQARLGV